MTHHYPERVKQLIDMYTKARIPGEPPNVIEVEETVGNLEPGAFPDPRVVALHPRQTRKVVFTRHEGTIALCDQSGKLLTDSLSFWWFEAEGYIISAGPGPDLPNSDAPTLDNMFGRLSSLRQNLKSLDVLKVLLGLPAPSGGLVTVPSEIAAKFQPAPPEPPKPSQRWHVVEIEGKPIMFDTEREAQAFIKRNNLIDARPFFLEKSYDWIIKLWR